MNMKGSHYKVMVDNGLSQEFKAMTAVNSEMHSHHYLLFNNTKKIDK